MSSDRDFCSVDCKLHEINSNCRKNEAIFEDTADVSTIKRPNEGKEKEHNLALLHGLNILIFYIMFLVENISTII